jgi:hypothetical protein
VFHARKKLTAKDAKDTKRIHDRNSKHQHPSSREAPNFKFRPLALDVGISSFSGAWSLDVGA